jgi:hypothetical protein
MPSMMRVEKSSFLFFLASFCSNLLATGNLASWVAFSFVTLFSLL